MNTQPLLTNPYRATLLGEADPSTAASGASSDAASAGPDASLLTPDALMAYCETRLSSLDGQMQSIFAQQQKSSQLITDIDNLVGTLNKDSNGINVKDGATVAGTADDPNSAFGQMCSQFNAVIAEAGGPNTPVGQQIQSALNQFTTDGNGGSGTDNNVSAPEMADIAKSLQQASSDASSGAELNMISLQSLMAQRQTAIQLSTNLVQALGTQMNAIASNIGK